MPTTDENLQSRKRDLHFRIARSRRRIERRLQETNSRARELMSWRTYVVRHPGWALLTALGGGMAASTLLRPKRISGWLGRSLLSYATGGLQQRVWTELLRILTSRSTLSDGLGFGVQGSDPKRHDFSKPGQETSIENPEP
jgi:hypothetical protein